MKKQCVVRTTQPYSKRIAIDYTKHFKGTEELEERLNSRWLVVSSQKLDNGRIEYILEKEVGDLCEDGNISIDGGRKDE